MIMIVSATAFRSYGYLKIGSEELNLKNIIQLNNEMLNKKVRAWSYLDHYAESGSSLEGMKMLVSTFGYDTDYISDAQKRAFKNTWDYIWFGFCKALSLDESTESLLNEFGLRLAQTNTEDAIISDVRTFYNDVIMWFLMTKKQGSKYNEGEVMKLLICGDMEHLRGYIINAIRD